MDKVLLRKELVEVFESELVDEMIQFDIMDLGQGCDVSTMGIKKMFLPFVVSGEIKIVRKGLKHDIVHYPVQKYQCCILAISAALRNAWSLPFMLSPDQRATVIADSDAKILAISPEKADIWMNKYDSWRKFVMKLYMERLRDLVVNNETITLQKETIEIQKQHVTDSIHYAQRIQRAVLASGWSVSEVLPENFVLYQPRDIVSGDFYWMSRISQEIKGKDEKDLIILAAADCTGHGVPGGFMSMLGIAFLNEIINHYDQLSSGGILDLLRDKIKSLLIQTLHFESPKDGMDIALAIIDVDKQKLQFSGANNPLYIIRNGELLEYKATKNPVGIHYKEVPFATNEIQLQKGDNIYVFTDGFADQVGGDAGEKLLKKRFKQMLLDIAHLNMQQQHNHLKDQFDNWQKEHEQVDDVLVLGIRI